jgi:hemin uptake protein HemP
VEVGIEDQGTGARLRRTRPINLIHFSKDSPERFIGGDGEIHISHKDLEWIRID